MSKKRKGISRDELERLNAISAKHAAQLSRKDVREVGGRRYAVYDANEVLERLSRSEHGTYRPGFPP